MHPRGDGKDVDAMPHDLAEILAFCDESDREGNSPKLGFGALGGCGARSPPYRTRFHYEPPPSPIDIRTRKFSRCDGPSKLRELVGHHSWVTHHVDQHKALHELLKGSANGFPKNIFFRRCRWKIFSALDDNSHSALLLSERMHKCHRLVVRSPRDAARGDSTSWSGFAAALYLCVRTE